MTNLFNNCLAKYKHLTLAEGILRLPADVNLAVLYKKLDENDPVNMAVVKYAVTFSLQRCIKVETYKAKNIHNYTRYHSYVIDKEKYPTVDSYTSMAAGAPLVMSNQRDDDGEYQIVM